MMLLRLAWRNLWRNKRRTLIILTSIVIGVVATDYLGNFSRGFMRQMFENQLGSHTSHLQIHARGFNDNKLVQNFMPAPDHALAALTNHPMVKHFSRRVIAFGLLSSASSSSGVSLVGIEPDREGLVTTIKQFLVAGRYLSGEKNEIVISKRLSQSLDVGLGDRVVAMASTLDGKVGSEMFRVVGIYHSPSLSFDRMYIYVPLSTAQEMLRVGDRIAEIAVIARDVTGVGSLKEDLLRELDSTFEVLTYQDLLPSLLSQIEMFDKIMLISYLVVALAMMFGIINTLLMSVFERIRELGVLKSIGMKNSQVFVMIELEALVLGVVGSVIGAGISVAVYLIMARNGLNLAMFSEGLAAFGTGAIVYPMFSLVSTVSEVVMVVLVCIVAAISPARRAVNLEPVQAIHFV